MNQNSIRNGLVERLSAVGVKVTVDAKVLQETVREGNRFRHVKEVDFWLSALSEDLQNVFRAFIDALMLRNYSYATIKNYRLAFFGVLSRKRL